MSKLNDTDASAAHVDPIPAGYYVMMQNPAVDDGEIDLRELFATVWRGRWIIILCTMLGAAVAIAVAVSLPNKYRAEALLAPVVDAGQSGLSSIAGQLGGLASLAGINLGGGQADDTALALATIKSRAFLTEFVKRRGLLVPLMAAKGWNADADDWVIDPDIYDAVSRRWIPQEQGEDPVPSDWDVYEKLSKQVQVSKDEKNGLVRVAVESLSPVAAKNWTQWLVEDINSHIQRREIEEAKRSVDYLQEQLQNTPNVDMRGIFYRLIEQQTQRRMLAEVGGQATFKIIDPPVVPEVQASPNRSLIAVLGTALGGMFGIMAVFLFDMVRRAKLTGRQAD